ncbi:DUF2357 domain-containing protein [Paraburkholderia fungorum]|uniref:DUF2357 domain-containing protein n=1 Tax=Paraburkholderia fungorum TaxID=134537 RepID=UPI0038BBA550
MLAALATARVEWADGTYILVTTADDSGEDVFEPLGESGRATLFGVTKHADALGLIHYAPARHSGFQPLSIFENGEYIIEVRLPLRLEEAITKRDTALSRSWPFLNTRLHPFLQVVSVRSWVEDVDGFTRITAFFNPREFLGSVDLTVWRDDRELFVEVESRKISYRDEYQALLENVADFHLGLIHEIGSPAATQLQHGEAIVSKPQASYFHMRRLMREEALPDALSHILRSPISVLEIEQRSMSPHRVRRVSPAEISKRRASMGFRAGGPLADHFAGNTPTTLPVRVKQESFDTPENRFVKAFLQDLYALLCDLESSAKADRKTGILEEVRRWRELIEDWLIRPVWRGIKATREDGANSQKLQRRIGYREVLLADAEIREVIALPLDGLENLPGIMGDAKPVHTLYEYWCYFMVRQAMTTLYGEDLLKGSTAIKESNGGLTLTLKTNRGKASAQWKLHVSDRLIEVFLFFQKSFSRTYESEWGAWSGSYSLQFDPDISIAVRIGEVTHWLVFDAKYRLESGGYGSDASLVQDAGKGSKQTFKKDDLNKMHTYRDAILGLRGAFILYPGPKDDARFERFVRQPITASSNESFPGVGALPLRPGNVAGGISQLQTFLDSSIKTLANFGRYQEESAGLKKSYPDFFE